MVDPSNFALANVSEIGATHEDENSRLCGAADSAIQRVSSIQPWRWATRASAVRLVTS